MCEYACCMQDVCMHERAERYHTLLHKIIRDFESTSLLTL
jgi:hypothetical protein